MKKIFIILLIIAVIGGGYWFFSAKNTHLLTSELNNSNTDGQAKGVIGSLHKAENTVTDFVSQKSKETENVSGGALHAIAEKSTSVITGVKNSFLEEFGNITRSAFTAVVNKGGELLGVGTSTVEYSSNVIPISTIANKTGDMIFSPLGTVIKRGQPLTFVISNEFFKSSNASEASYDISWGDGGGEHQKIYSEGKNKFVTHTFQKAGEYKPIFTFDTGKNKTQYKILVIVEEY